MDRPSTFGNFQPEFGVAHLGARSKCLQIRQPKDAERVLVGEQVDRQHLQPCEKEARLSAAS